MYGGWAHCVCAALRDLAGIWQEYVATDLGVEDDLDDEETSGLAPMIGLIPGSTFEANTRVTRRYGCELINSRRIFSWFVFTGTPCGVVL